MAHVPPGEEAPTRKIPHKTRGPKVMFLAAVAWPVRSKDGEGWDCDGRIGFIPVGETVKQQRKSPNMEKGDKKFKKGTIDTDTFVKYLKTKIVPAALAQADNIEECLFLEIQCDGAGGHGMAKEKGRKKVLKLLNDWGAEKGGPLTPKGKRVLVTFICQPSQSPDFNVLDLGAWTSLQAAVDELDLYNNERTNMEMKLVKACQKAWDRWASAEKLTSLFDSWLASLNRVAEVDGDTKYEQPRKKQKK